MDSLGIGLGIGLKITIFWCCVACYLCLVSQSAHEEMCGDRRGKGGWVGGLAGHVLLFLVRVVGVSAYSFKAL